MKKINQLIECDYDIDIWGIADDSRDIKQNYLFVATKGYFVDHFDYIDDAILNGAVCVIADRYFECSIPLIIVENVNDCYLNICKRYYNVDPNDFDLIGITGTDGKTTTTTIISKLLNSVSKTACLGTNGLLIDTDYYPTNNTTPGGNELYDKLSITKINNCKGIVMEVSSEALLHNRIKDFKFDVIGFTNITEDHLNIHKSVDEYIKIKLELLNYVKKDGVIVVNGDDEKCRLIDSDNVYTFGVGTDNDFVIRNVKKMTNSVEFCICHLDKIYKISSPLFGVYNIYNVTMAFVICLLKNVDVDLLIQKIKTLEVIKGRREYLDFGQPYDIILDYAHTYNGIKNILESVSNYKEIIVVTGAAGGREKEKRSKIGELVLNLSDITIFTMDDPRFEVVDDIIDQMVSTTSLDYIRIINRKEAIFKALSLAKKGSVVLVLGKGRDDYMVIEDRKEKYCDYDVICEYFSEQN